MKHSRSFSFLRLLVFSVSALFINGCTEPIVFDLEGEDSQITIEGFVSNELTYFTIGRTTSLYGQGLQNVEEDVSVQLIAVELKDTITLQKTVLGEAQNVFFPKAEDNFRAGSLITYKAIVTIGDQQYTSTAKVPTLIPFTGMNIEEDTRTFGGDDDPEDQTSYLFKYDFDLKNDQYASVGHLINLVQKDRRFELFQGNASLQALNPKQSIIDVRDQDQVIIALYAINEDTYEYYRELTGIIGGGPPSKNPANPESNWSPDVLGRFVVAAVDFKAYRYNNGSFAEEQTTFSRPESP